MRVRYSFTLIWALLIAVIVTVHLGIFFNAHSCCDQSAMACNMQMVDCGVKDSCKECSVLQITAAPPVMKIMLTERSSIAPTRINWPMQNIARRIDDPPKHRLA